MHLEELTGRTKAFINFSNDMLVSEIPLLLPKDEVVIEVLETVEINDELIAACQKLRDEGYIIALDDFEFDKSFLPLLELAHIVKIEFTTMNIELQAALIEKFKHKVKFLAEKVETREQHQLAMEMGYQYFQGYFYSKPVVLHSRDIKSLSVNHIQILAELENVDIDYDKIIQIIREDIGLSYKLLKLANSAFLGSRHKVTSVKQALVRIGTLELKKWVYLLMIQSVQTINNKELLRTCLIRGRFMELLACEVGDSDNRTAYFVAGTFSEIDNILSREMDEVVEELALQNNVKDALLGVGNSIRDMLDKVIYFENNSEWKEGDSLNSDVAMKHYLAALAWVLESGYN